MRALVVDCLAKDPSARPTPEQVARRLAPDGAASLAVSGWLPGLLVEQVSRSAVSLLDLEAAQPEQGSGLVEFSSPSVGEPGEPGSVGGQGGAVVPPNTEVAQSPTGAPSTTGPTPNGPPSAGPQSAGPPSAGPQSAGPPSAAGPQHPAGPQHFDPRSAGPPPPGVPGFGPPDPTYAEAAAQQATATSAAAPRDGRSADSVPPQRGRIAVSVDAGSVPGAGGRGRRMSCTIALAVAGALAAVTVGSVFVFGLLPDEGEHAGADGAKKPPAAGERQPDAQPGKAIPRRFLGTWEGKAEAIDGVLPAGTLKLVVEQARPGEEFGTASMTDELGLSTCTDVLVLKKATADEIVATGRPKVKGDARCTENTHTVRITPVGDDLNYVSENPAGGNPKARLSRQ